MVLKIHPSAVDDSCDNLAVPQFIQPQGSQLECCFSNFNVHRNHLWTLLKIDSDEACLEGARDLIF